MARLVTLFDVKANLNIQGTSNDDELTGFLLDGIAAIEDIIGPVSPRPYTDVVDAHGARIVLPRMPVLSVQSVVIAPWLGATPIDDTAAWIVNTDTGVLRRQLTGGTMPFYGRGSVFQITYTVGRDPNNVPGPINRAILLQVAEMWRSQRGAMTAASGGDVPLPSYGGAVGFLSPGVMELLIPYLPPPGIA